MAAPASSKTLDWLSYIRYLVIRFVLWLTRETRKSRFAGVYDLSQDDPFKYGAIPSTTEYEQEWPLEEKTMLDRKINDVISFFCTSSTGQILALNLTRSPNKTASAFIYLKTSKATYTLTRESFVDLSAEDVFAIDGLKLECLTPHKKWRISFNGLMRNKSTGKDEHVRFVFTSNFVNSLADIGTFHAEKFLALQLCENSSTSLWNLLSNPSYANEQLKEIDCIVQTFSFVGKIRVKENLPDAKSKEEDMYAFGHKKRSHEKISSAVESLGSLMAYTRNGISVYLEESKVANFSPALLTGFLHYPSFVHARIDVAPLNLMKNDNIEKQFPLGISRLHPMEFKIEEQIDQTEFTHEFNSGFHKRTVRVFKITYDDKEGYAVFFGGMGKRVEPDIVEVPKHLRTKAPVSKSNVFSFNEEACSNGDLTGGKASSLAVLTSLAKQSGKFQVAKGVAVSTEAYAQFAKQPAVKNEIEKLENALRAANGNEFEVCKEVVEIIGKQKLPEKVKEDLENKLKLIFDDIEGKRFAVRSSACGEDSEDMSAAGQMETLLGVKGFSNICEAVAKCWASQFSFVAVQYRRRYGQVINCPMAVCVQEMVASEVSGVMFTVDPLTANPNFITITANYGLGESVVSAAADPDTFVLEKTPNGGKLFSSTIGAKKLRTVMLDEGGTKDVTDSEDKTSCLNETQLSQLAEAAREVEKHYASQRDTEWAFAPGGKQLLMLQARPVTSAHVLDTEFEYYHEQDSGLVSEFDCLSKANVGEVFGGSVSPLTLEVTFGCFIRSMKIQQCEMMGIDTDEVMFVRDQFFFRQNGQCFFGTFSMMTDYTKEDIISKGFSISMCGRVIDDEIVKIGANNKRPYLLKGNMPPPWRLLSDLWTAESKLDEAEKFVGSAQCPLSECKTSKEMFLRVLRIPMMMEKALESHGAQIMYGSMINVVVLALFSHTEGGFTTKVYSDFARLVASCNNLVSADIPQSLQRVTHQAQKDYGVEFKKLTPEEALLKLQNDSNKTTKLFAEFLENHGHRCMHEFDLVVQTWGMNPIPVVKTIQAMIGTAEILEKGDVSVDELLKGMEIKLNLTKRLLLRFMVERVRKGIAHRERGKSCLILASHKYRLLFREIANKMVEENRLADPDLLFFLTPSEIFELLNTRSPKIIIRAMNRKKNAARAAKDIYSEHNAGLPFKPLNYASDPIEAKGSRRMTGTPVSQGSIVGTARVVISLDDAHLIEKGDILITYATDIGWSPYFPLLGGIVTELGGLISHGAVVAREYGLPCIVAAHGAPQLFRSGDKVLLDGTNGFIQTVE